MIMMKNRLVDLNNHLFEQLERLNDEDLKPEQLKMEIDRAKSMGFLGSQIIANAKLVLDAAELFNNADIVEAPEVFGLKEKND
jgi:hypothetical protein